MLKEFNFKWENISPHLIIDALIENTCTISFLEITDTSWLIEGVIDEEYADDLSLKLEIFCLAHECPVPKLTFFGLREKDWVKEFEKASPSLTIGPFYIFGSHISEEKPLDKISIHLDATAAFGSGRHESTSGCLLAIDKLLKTKSVNNILDLGTGSGILAIAASKLSKASIYASDIDPDSVRIATENSQNNSASHLKIYLSEGFSNQELQSNAPFDLIIANILAAPLENLASEMAHFCASKGNLILSGILNEQAPSLIHTYQKEGFEVEEQMEIGQWSILILQKKI